MLKKKLKTTRVPHRAAILFLLPSVASFSCFSASVTDKISDVDSGVSLSCGAPGASSWFCNTDLDISSLSISVGDKLKFYVPKNVKIQEAQGAFIITSEDCEFSSDTEEVDKYLCRVSKTGGVSKNELIIGLSAQGDSSLLHKDIRLFDVHPVPPQPLDPMIEVTAFSLKDRMGNEVKNNPEHFVPTLSKLMADLSFTTEANEFGKAIKLFYSLTERTSSESWREISSENLFCQAQSENGLSCQASFDMSAFASETQEFKPGKEYVLRFSYLTDKYHPINFNDESIFATVQGAYVKPINARIYPAYDERNIDPSRCFFSSPNNLYQECEILIGSKSATVDISYLHDPDQPVLPTLDGKDFFQLDDKEQYSIVRSKINLNAWNQSITDDHSALLKLSNKASLNVHETFDIRDVVDVDSRNNMSNYYLGLVQPEIANSDIGIKARLRGSSGDINASTWHVTVEGKSQFDQAFSIDSDGNVKFVGGVNISPQILNLKVTGTIHSEKYTSIFPVSVQSSENLIWGMNESALLPMQLFHERAILIPPKDGYRKFGSLADMPALKWTVRPLENRQNGQIKAFLMASDKCMSVVSSSNIISPKECDASSSQIFDMSLNKPDLIYLSSDRSKALNYATKEGTLSYKVTLKGVSETPEYQRFNITYKYPGAAYAFDVKEHKIPVQAKSYEQAVHNGIVVDDDYRKPEYTCAIGGVSSCNITSSGLFTLPENKEADYSVNVSAKLAANEYYFEHATNYTLFVKPSLVKFIKTTAHGYPRFSSDEAYLNFVDLDRRAGSDPRGNMYFSTEDGKKLTNDFAIDKDDVTKVKMISIPTISVVDIQTNKKLKNLSWYCHLWDSDPGTDDTLCSGSSKADFIPEDKWLNKKSLSGLDSYVVEGFTGWNGRVESRGTLLFEPK